MTHNSKEIGPKYFGTSKKRSIFDVPDESIPGPGTYDNHKINIKKKSPEWPLGLDENRNTFLYSTPVSNPSPQKYKINFQAIEKKSKKMTIPHSQHELLNHTNPNFYESNYQMTKPKSSQFSFGYYFGNNYNTIAPGPGQYEVEKTKIKKNKKNGFSSSIRPQPYGQEGKNPGPGQYLTIDLQKGTKISFPKASKSQQKFTDPPAQFYDIGVIKKTIRGFRGPTSQIHHQKPIKQNSQIPAPNAYTSQLKRKIPGGSIDKAIRPSIENPNIMQFPSSTKYDTNTSDIDKKMISFPKQIRRPQLPNQNIPGPKYDLGNTFTNIGGKINRMHRNQQKQINLPGAGSYDLKDEIIRRKAQSSIVFVSQRTDFSKTITGPIGPGHYNNTNTNNKSCFGKLSKAERKVSQNNDQNPGVGNYQIPYGIGKLPSYCKSPKKLSQTGYSVFYQKMQAKINKLKMKKIKDAASQHLLSRQSENANPQEPINIV